MTIKIIPNTKIRIKSPEHSEYVQELAFASGFIWKSLKRQNELFRLDAKCLYFDEDYSIKWGFPSYFEETKAQEIFIDLPPPEGQTFSCARVGDRVFHLQAGWGTVVEVDFDDPDLQIGVLFDVQKVAEWYRVDGRVEVLDKLPSLYWDEIKIVPPPKPVRVKLVHGVEVPDISFKPYSGDYYFTPNPSVHYLRNRHQYSLEGLDDVYRAEQNLCYPDTEEGEQAAIAHAKAWLGVQ